MCKVPSEKLLDARELEAPLPLEYAIKIAKELQNDEYLKMLHRMKPCKLGDVLNAMNLAHIYFEDNGIHYTFCCSKNDTNTKLYIQERIKDEYGRTFSF